MGPGSCGRGGAGLVGGTELGSTEQHRGVLGGVEWGACVGWDMAELNRSWTSGQVLGERDRMQVGELERDRAQVDDEGRW